MLHSFGGTDNYRRTESHVHIYVDRVNEQHIAPTLSMNSRSKSHLSSNQSQCDPFVGHVDMVHSIGAIGGVISRGGLKLRVS